MVKRCPLDYALQSEVRPSDSVSHDGLSFTSNRSRRSVSSSGLCLSVKIKVAKAEWTVAKLKLNELKKKIELQRQGDAVRQEQEVLEVENEFERANL